MTTSNTSSTTLLVIDDEELIREGLASFFRRLPDHELVGSAASAAEGIALAAELRPDVILMDLHMPRMSGIEATRAILLENPDACIVALTTFSDRSHIVEMMQAGAAGYLLKNADRATLTASIDAARRGDMPLSADVRKELVATLARQPTPEVDAPQLAPRERELLEWLALGLSNQEIAQHMYLAEGSVKQYLLHIGEKLQRRSRTQILVRAIQLGLVDPHNLPEQGTRTMAP